MSITATTLSSTPITDGLPISSELTVAQAARLIDVPVGYIDELLDTGLVVFRWENDKRLVQWSSLQGFEADRERRHAELDKLFLMFQEAGLSDE
jgi:hypothetical protein